MSTRTYLTHGKCEEKGLENECSTTKKEESTLLLSIKALPIMKVPFLLLLYAANGSIIADLG